MDIRMKRIDDLESKIHIFLTLILCIASILFAFSIGAMVINFICKLLGIKIYVLALTSLGVIIFAPLLGLGVCVFVDLYVEKFINCGD